MDLGKISSGLHAAQQRTQPEEQKLKEVAQGFEAILIASLLKEARPSEQAGLFGGGLSQDLYRQLFTDEIAKAIARSGGIGVGKMLEQQLRATLRVGVHENRLKEPSQSTDITKRDR
jgi:Rod binding domain-containing protein